MSGSLPDNLELQIFAMLILHWPGSQIEWGKKRLLLYTMVGDVGIDDC
jgi:hypothetical protein